MMTVIQKFPAYLCTLSALVLLSACGETVQTEAKYPTGAERTTTGGDIYAEPDSIFGAEGLKIFGGKERDTDESDMSVNSFLWRASLDTVSFMPLASADPFGGVILTDWHRPEGIDKERFKVNVFILSRTLRSDGVRVRVFRQVKKGNAWVEAEASDAIAHQLEDTILTRARQLRVAQLNSEDE